MTAFLYICGALAMAGFALNNTQEPLTGKNLLGVLIVAIGWPYWLGVALGELALERQENRFGDDLLGVARRENDDLCKRNAAFSKFTNNMAR